MSALSANRYGRTDPRERVGGMLFALLVQGALLYALIVGLSVKIPQAIGESLKIFDAPPEAPPPPPPTTKPHVVKSKRPEGAAAPPNLRSRATEIVVPPPIVPLIIPPRIVAAEKPGPGFESTSGSADRVGPGTGAGGVGNGLGSGRFGDGDGGGEGWEDETPPRQIKGRLSYSDLPDEITDAVITGTVEVRYVVAVNGRVPDCRVTRSSGNATLDETTCRLIRQRFRFKPSRDADGHAVQSTIIAKQMWLGEEPPSR